MSNTNSNRSRQNKVLLYSERIEKAKQEILELKGRVLLVLGPKVFVAMVPVSLDLTKLRHSTTSVKSEMLDRNSLQAAKAWKAHVTGEKIEPIETRNKKEGLSWDSPGYRPPDSVANTSQYLTGSVAVGIVTVSGPHNYLKLSDVERQTIIQEVEEGLDFLANDEPEANLTFELDIHHITVPILPEYVRLIPDHWHGWPDSFTEGIDAAVLIHPFIAKAYFFKGDQYIRYDLSKDKVDSGYPRSIADNWHNWPSSFSGGIDAALLGAKKFAGKIYFFKGDQYIRYDLSKDKVDSGYPKSTADNWHGWPSNFPTSIDAALLGAEGFSGKAYFFAGAVYIRYDLENDRVDPGYPKYIVEHWHNWPDEFSDGIDAALLGGGPLSGKAYLFRKDKYVRYDWGNDCVDYSSYEDAESPWRNAALEEMGYSGSRSGSRDYVNQLRSNKGIDWAYVGYFTKYPLHHFAYASGERLVINYENDGWGPSLINRVFTHETCHLFGAADEYQSSECTCDSLNGSYGVPNYNCENCPGAKEPCIMLKNSLVVCKWTRGQIGWDWGLQGIGAAFLKSAEKVYFFSQDSYTRYNFGPDRADKGYPNKVTAGWHNWPPNFPTNIDAALKGSGNFEGKAYFFKGDYYIRYDMVKDKVDSGYPNKVTAGWHNWPPNFPTNIDAALSKGKKAYFFKGDYYIRYDMVKDKVDSGYPKKIRAAWPFLLRLT